MDVGCSINPALDVGQVCGTDFPDSLFVKVKTSGGSARNTSRWLVHRLFILSLYSECFRSGQPRNSNLLVFKKGKGTKVFQVDFEETYSL